MNSINLEYSCFDNLSRSYNRSILFLKDKELLLLLNVFVPSLLIFSSTNRSSLVMFSKWRERSSIPWRNSIFRLLSLMILPYTRISVRFGDHEGHLFIGTGASTFPLPALCTTRSYPHLQISFQFGFINAIHLCPFCICRLNSSKISFIIIQSIIDFG
jgi:hypothetical protein